MEIKELLTFDTEDSTELLVKAGLTPIMFAEADPEKVMTQLIKLHEIILGKTLSPSDPNYLVYKVITYALVSLRQRIDYSGKQNLLPYAVNSSLDHIGLLVGATRIPPKKAVADVKITLSGIQNSAVTIPKGTRVTAGDNIFFVFPDDAVILAGNTTTTAKVECMMAGEIGNGYLPGQIKTMVDLVPWVKEIVNITTSAAGAEQESDEQYRERIHIAPESFSSAGPSGAYEYYALSANASIIDAYIEGPELREGARPGEVDIYVLLDKGMIPDTAVLEEVRKKCDNKRIRPLTDRVNVKAPGKKTFNFTATYYVAKSMETQQGAIQEAVNKAVEEFEQWQRSRLGRDIEPTELIYRMRAAGAKRVEVGFAHTVVANNEIAWASSKTITYGGIEDD